MLLVDASAVCCAAGSTYMYRVSHAPEYEPLTFIMILHFFLQPGIPVSACGNLFFRKSKEQESKRVRERIMNNIE